MASMTDFMANELVDGVLRSRIPAWAASTRKVALSRDTRPLLSDDFNNEFKIEARYGD